MKFEGFIEQEGDAGCERFEISGGIVKRTQ